MKQLKKECTNLADFVVCKAMFELGPEWLDKYVRAFMKEVVAEELEKVIVMGTGKNNQLV